MQIVLDVEPPVMGNCSTMKQVVVDTHDIALTATVDHDIN